MRPPLSSEGYFAGMLSKGMPSKNVAVVRAMYERRERGTLRDGLIVRWEYYWERADALEAAGISE